MRVAARFVTALTVLAGALGGAGLVGPASAQIANRDVFIVAEQLADEVELIREVMGRPYDDSARFPVAGVSMTEVFFQAQTLLRKSNQLARELAGAPEVAVPPVPAGDIRAADVHALVAAALAQIRLVRAELGITEPVAPRERETDIAPTGLFSTIIDSNRQLNLMLEKTITSADVFEEVSTALEYANGLLAARGLAAGGDEPFEAAKRSADVYLLLLDCIDIVSRIAHGEGIAVVSLSSRRNVPDDVEPGHVYDLANILVADLATLARVARAEPVPDAAAARPKHVFPSHVFERAGTLRRRLAALEAAQ